MNWKVVVALGAVAGVVLAALRRKRITADDDELWAEATDHVTRFGNP